MNDTDRNSRLPGFHRLSVDERIRSLCEAGALSEEDARTLAAGLQTLRVDRADRMIENVVGVFGLPLGLGLNLTVNARDHVVPMVVEEPSIVAGLSAAARTMRNGGGVFAEAKESLLIGQIQVLGLGDVPAARSELLARRQEIVDLADSLHPNMVARGGGVREVEVHVHPSHSGTDMLVLHLLVDTRDAMGANLVNTMCEGVAPLVESITGGRVCLRILSNLADRSLVRARVRLEPGDCTVDGSDGRTVCEGIVAASELAAVDRYRAATHNKGIMNGIDAVAIATGNDWRSIEAGAHAHAATGGHYRGLSRWYLDPDDKLVGELELPLKVGTVGGNLQTNPAVALNQKLLGVNSARELAEVMAAVGLAQNFSALRALVAQGIQHGHMTLHARSVATAAGASPAVFDDVVDQLVECGEIKVWKARSIVESLEADTGSRAGSGDDTVHGIGHGKIILLGEHAAVYGSHVLAAPVPLAVEARVEDAPADIELIIPRWGVERRLPLDPEQRHSFEKPIGLILEQLGLADRALRIQVFPHVPRAMGLGCSAALAVSVIRALDLHYKLGLDDDYVNTLAHECEKVAHGNPSGVDNHVATFNRPIIYRRGEPPTWKTVTPAKRIRLVVGITGIESLTARTVANVRAAHERDPARYDRIFAEIDALALEGVEAIEQHDLERLGSCMNFCHGLLNALGVSSRELEMLVAVARESGALGAKLTGGGGGGSMIALCGDESSRVREAMQQAGFQAMEIEIG